VEADVYVWRYTLLVVHARKEEEEVALTIKLSFPYATEIVNCRTIYKK